MGVGKGGSVTGRARKKKEKTFVSIQGGGIETSLIPLKYEKYDREEKETVEGVYPKDRPWWGKTFGQL